MALLNYLLYYGFIYPLSLLPFPILYLISDVTYMFIYRIFGYRKKVVRLNLRNVFPEKSEAELFVIEKLFYRHFCDLIVESIKNFSISADALSKRMHCVNPELLKDYYEKGRSVIAVTGHYANWEWAGTLFGYYSKHKAMGIYLPLKNKFWDKLMRDSRGKAGTFLVATKDVGNFFNEHKDIPVAAGFIADQSPGNPDKAYWMNFLNQDTAIQFGTEKYANEYNCVVVYGAVKKIKRGFYELKYHTITESPGQLKYGELTALHTRFNEQLIRSAPQYWLWTHKRWKHKRKPTNI